MDMKEDTLNTSPLWFCIVKPLIVNVGDPVNKVKSLPPVTIVPVISAESLVVK